MKNLNQFEIIKIQLNLFIIYLQTLLNNFCYFNFMSENILYFENEAKNFLTLAVENDQSNNYESAIFYYSVHNLSVVVYYKFIKGSCTMYLACSKTWFAEFLYER